MSKLMVFSNKIKDFFSGQKSEFLSNKLKYILKVCCWFCFVFLTLSIQLLTMLEDYHLIPVILTAVFGAFVFTYCFLYGKFVFNTISIFYLFFVFYSFVVTLFGSKDFSTFFLTQVKLTILMVIVFNFCVNFYKPKIFLNLLILLAIAISFLFLATSFKDIFSLNKPTSESRIGNNFFGNVNYLGGALGSGVFFVSVYLCYYKKHFLPLLIFSLFLIFLILRTGSRMPFIVSIISIVFTLFYLFWKTHKLAVFISMMVLLACFVLIMALPQFSSFSKRFLAVFEIISKGGSSEASANQRLSMQFVAIQFWLKRFFFGYGSSGFANITSFGTYSHSTLCELLCDYGIFGCWLFYFPLIYFLLQSKKKSLSNVAFLVFTLSQLVIYSFLGMLIYEKRFYIYIAIFASIFFAENTEKDFYFIVQRTTGLKFSFVSNIGEKVSSFKNERIKRNNRKKSLSKQKILNAAVIFSIFSILFLSIRTVCSFSNTSKKETIAENISVIARNSSTRSANINVNPKVNGVKFSELESLALSCRNSNLNKTSVDSYNFRLIYDSKQNQRMRLNSLEDFNPTLLVHTTAGTHKNAKGENVFDWYELKMMFEGNHFKSYKNITTFVEIREIQAKRILAELGYEYSYENCERVLLADDYYLDGFFGSEGYDYPIKLKINNIILENEGMDERYSKTHGDYLLINPMNFPTFDGYSVSFDFGTSFPETCNYLDYIENQFERGKYQYELNTLNLDDLDDGKKSIDEIDDWCKNGLSKGISDVVLFLVIFSIFIASITTIVLGFSHRKVKNIKYFLLGEAAISYTFAYLLFFIFSSAGVSYIEAGFSVFSSLISLLLLFILALAAFVLQTLCKTKQKEKECTQYFEISI